MIICGDLNAKCCAWYEKDRTDEAGNILNQLFSAYNLEQVNSFPTHIYGDSLKSCLDIVATDVPMLTTRSLPPLGRSDHLVILGTFPTTERTEAVVNTVWCWTRADLPKLKEAVSNTDWTAVYNCSDVNEAWNNWRTELMKLAQQYVPQKQVTHQPCPRPWMTPDIALEVKKKHRLFRSYKRQRTDAAWQDFKAQRNIVNSLIRTAKSNYVLDLQDYDYQGTTGGDADNPIATDQDIVQRPSLPCLHKFLRLFTKSRSSHIPDLLDGSGRLIQSDQEKAEVFNQFFIGQAQQASYDDKAPPVSSPETLDQIGRAHV